MRSYPYLYSLNRDINFVIRKQNKKRVLFRTKKAHYFMIRRPNCEVYVFANKFIVVNCNTRSSVYRALKKLSLGKIPNTNMLILDSSFCIYPRLILVGVPIYRVIKKIREEYDSSRKRS